MLEIANASEVVMLKMKLLAFALALIGTLCLAAPFAEGREKVPVDGALNASLKEKDQVQRTYKRNSGARRDAKARAGRDEDRRIKLEVGDEIGAVSASGGSDEALAFRSRARDEDTAPSFNIEQEMKDIHRDIGRELKRAPNSSGSGAGDEAKEATVSPGQAPRPAAAVSAAAPGE